MVSAAQLQILVILKNKTKGKYFKESILLSFSAEQNNKTNCSKETDNWYYLNLDSIWSKYTLTQRRKSLLLTQNYIPLRGW